MLYQVGLIRAKLSSFKCDKSIWPLSLIISSLPGCQTLLSPSSSEQDTSLSCATSKGALKSDDVGEEGEAVDGKLSIFIHKREDQSSHEVLQPLLRYLSGKILDSSFISFEIFFTYFDFHRNAAVQRDVLFGLALEQTWKKW